MTQPPADTAPEYTPAPPADFILSFDLANAGVRGRLVRLDAVSARALSAHDLPEAANRTLGETLALSALLGSAVKLDGRLTIQTQSDGPLDLVAADYYGAEAGDDGADRARRGCAPMRGWMRPASAFWAMPRPASNSRPARARWPSPSSRGEPERGAATPIRASWRWNPPASANPPRPISPSPSSCRP